MLTHQRERGVLRISVDNYVFNVSVVLLRDRVEGSNDCRLAVINGGNNRNFQGKIAREGLERRR